MGWRVPLHLRSTEAHVTSINMDANGEVLTENK